MAGLSRKRRRYLSNCDDVKKPKLDVKIIATDYLDDCVKSARITAKLFGQKLVQHPECQDSHFFAQRKLL